MSQGYIFVMDMAAAVVSGSLLTIGASCWPMAWMGLELNLLGFVPLAMLALNNKKSAMTYFVVQSIGSLLLLYGGVTSGVVVFGCVVGVLLKMGLAPLHFWVPPVAAGLNRMSFSILLTWQKIAPLSLLIFITFDKSLVVVMNLAIGALMMLSAACLPALLIFSGLIQMAWVISLGGAMQMWHYLSLYYLSLIAVIAYQRSGTSAMAIALMNAGGLPPMTGFMIKVRAIMSMRVISSIMLLAGSGAALVSYVRFMLSSKLRWENPPIPLLITITAGSV